ncbi:MAG: hypothetical protein JXA99_04095 [Candidatus Lokiarchaeota archaeon]|nr:hypothetical protein [Candidatus Lokiarchaeota archaeon]
MEIFLKRAEGPFKEKIGEQKTNKIFDLLKKVLFLIPGEYSGTLGTEIPRLLFNYSRNIQNLSNESIEGILNHFLVFSTCLKDLANQNIKQVNQNIINRSKSEIKNLSDLLNQFIEKAKNGNIIQKSDSFGDILNFMIGSSQEVTQLDEYSLFIKRAIDNFKELFEEDYIIYFSEEFSKVFDEIDHSLKDTIGSEIVKFIFKLSQDISRLSKDDIKKKLNAILLFNHALKDTKGKNKNQLDQEIIRRSKNTLGNLFDFFVSFTEKALKSEFKESIKSINDILDLVLGEEKEHVKFTDVGGFLKRVEDKYGRILGNFKAEVMINELLTSLSELPEAHGSYLASDISRYLTKYSETMNKIDPKEIELTLSRSLIFTNSLKELTDLTKEEINQFIINRSKRKIRSLFDLYKLFLKTNKPIFIKSKNPNFDEIIEYTLGKYEGPKVIEEASNIHDLLADYHEEIPLSKEHSNWADAINLILTRYIEILPNDKGDRLIDELWNNKYPENKIIKEFRDKVLDLPREDEKIFMFRLMNLLTRPVLKDKDEDKALTGSVAFVILGKILLEIYSGRNPMIRAIKMNQLLKDRKYADNEKKQSIDEHINSIIKEDLNAIKKRTMIIRSIIPILTLKGFYIQSYDINRKKYPDIIVDMFKDVSPLESIGKENLKTQKGINTLGNINTVFYYLDLVKKFDKYFFKESESIPLDSMKKREILDAYFKSLFELYENLEVNKFYDHNIIASDRLIYIYIMKYLYEPSEKTFKLIENFLDENQDYIKVKSMDYYLSQIKLKESKMSIDQLHQDIQNAASEGLEETSDKLARLKNMLEQQKLDITKFRFMEDLYNESKDIRPVLEARVIFSRSLLTFLDIVKDINRNLSAIFPQYLTNLLEFTGEIDKTHLKVQKLRDKKLISPSEYYEINKANEMAKNKLIELSNDENFTNHIKYMISAYENISLYQEYYETMSIEVEESEVIEEINPLEKYFKMYLEELTAVPSTDSINKFMDAFNFWLKDEILPVTYNKAEQVLLNIIFNKIKKRYLAELTSSV